MAIFFSFLVFHIIQDVILIRRKVATFKHVLSYYLISALVVSGFYFGSTLIDKKWVFIIFWTAATFILLLNKQKLILFYKKPITQDVN